MRRLVVATQNPGKLREIRRVLQDLQYEIKSLVDYDSPPHIDEDQPTFEGNAIKKAVTIAEAFGIPALSDDSGLEVDALNGNPGVHSARYGGPGLTDKDRYEKLLVDMKAVPLSDRSCRFRTVVVYAEPGALPRSFYGVMEGTLAFEAKGDAGFGYDPVFIPMGMDRTVAELGQTVKDKISHRAEALAAFSAYIHSTVRQ